MNENRKEEIILATLKLASKKGLGNVSMSMIAESIGIKKPSLYNHFVSKDELVKEMYVFLRERAKEKTKTSMPDFQTLLNMKSPYEILKKLVGNYILMNSEENIQMFYKVIYSESTISTEAAEILVNESNQMIEATKQIFVLLEKNKLLSFENINLSATIFAITIHRLIDLENNKNFIQKSNQSINTNLIDDLIANFCNKNKYKE